MKYILLLASVFLIVFCLGYRTHYLVDRHHKIEDFKKRSSVKLDGRKLSLEWIEIQKETN
jgi:hypothetical protein